MDGAVQRMEGQPEGMVFGSARHGVSQQQHDGQRTAQLGARVDRQVFQAAKYKRAKVDDHERDKSLHRHELTAVVEPP